MKKPFFGGFVVDYVLGIDLGTTAVKAALFDQNGQTIASSIKEYKLHTPSPLVVELDPEVYWQALKNALAEIKQTKSADMENIRSLGISAQGETIIPIDNDGKALRNAIVWMDNRAEDESKWLTGHFTNDTIYKVTGQVSMLPMWPAAKILWLKQHEPGIYNRTFKFLLIEDYFIYRLTGTAVSEGSLLCSTCYWDIHTRRYWPEMLQVLGIREDQLPETREPGESVSPIKPDVAEELGLSPKTIITTGALDQAAGAIGVGNVSPGIFTECTGSNIAIVSLVDGPTEDPNKEMPCFYYGLPQTYMIHAFSMTGGMVLKWFRDHFFGENGRAETTEGRETYEVMTEMAASITPGSSGLLMLPHLQGAGVPESNPNARGVFYGLSLHHGKAHMVRAILEAIAMNLRRMVEAVQAMGISVKEVRSLGGGAKSELWCQIKADVLGLPVYTMKNTQDAACLGAAILAGVAVGVWPSVKKAVDSFVEIDRVFEPDPDNKSVYDEYYGAYIDIYNNLIPIFEKRLS
jgi:D-xylulose kinase